MNNPSEKPTAPYRPKILIVDDKQENLFALENVLTKVDAEVIRADSGQAALAKVLDHHFSLIILDVRMPGMDGYEVAEHLQSDSATKEIPLIFVTAEYPEETHIIRGYEAGAIDYILKPYSPRILLSKVNILLEMARNKKELLRHRDQLEDLVLERTAQLQEEMGERKRTLVELEESERALLEAQSIASLGSYTLDISSGNWKGSRGLNEVFGIDETYIRNVESWQALVHPEDRVLISDYLINEVIGKKITFNKEYRIVRQSDGAERWVLGLGRLELNESGQPLKMLGTIQDITERKKSEIALRESEQRFNIAADAATIGVWEFDVLKEHLVWDDRMFQLYGIQPDGFTGAYEVWYKGLHPEDRQRALDEVGAATSGQKPFDTEFRIVRTDGNIRYIHAYAKVIRDKDGSPLRMIGTNQDITELKQAEAEADRLMAAIIQIAEGVVITDLEGRIEYVNPAFEKMTGYTSEEAVDHSPNLLKSGEQGNAFYQELWGTIASGRTWNGRIVNRKKDGSLYTEDQTISPLKDSSGNIVNYVAVKRDVTEEINREEQLRQAQKMESIGQLVGGVAHDFNNLLQVINGYAEIAHLMIKPDHPASVSIMEISKAGERAKDLVRQLLAFSRQQVIDPSDLDLNEEIESAYKMIGRLIGEHIQLKFISGTDLGKIYADKGQINQVVMNLCVNARDAMPDGGTLTLKTESVEVKPEDMNTHGEPFSPGHYVLLSITDTGCGMPKKVCEKIFEPFFTTKGVGKGTGLGLSTVYGIVKQNEGHIEVSSEPDKGATFKIYLPLSKSLPDETKIPASENTVATKGGTETVLIVEDEEMLLKLATHCLKGSGYTVLNARNGEEAVQVFTEHADDIDLVMMDVVMPRMGGKKAIAEILKQRPSLRYLFVSGYSLDAGHNDFIKEKKLHMLSKPYQASALLKKIREILDEDL